VTFLVFVSNTLIKKEKITLPDWKILVPILLFILSGVISIFISPDMKSALGLFKAFIVDPILVFFMAFSIIRSKEDFDLIIKSLIAGGVLVSIQAIWQKFTGHTALDGRVIGIFGYKDQFASPNYLAMYLVPIITLALTYEAMIFDHFLGVENIKKMWFYDVSFFVMVFALYLTQSRGALGAVFIGIIVFIIIKNWQWIKSRNFAVFLLSVFFLLSIYFGWQMVKPDWNLSPDAGGRVTASNNIHFEIWKTTVNNILIKDYNWLIGVGLGNYQNYFTSTTKNWVNYPEFISPNALTPHNIFLNIWLNLGLLGIISFVWILVMFFFSLLKPQNQSVLKQVFISVMITILVHGMLDTTYWKNDLSVMFWILVGTAYTFLINGAQNEKN
jgi:O-antigen ligase